jgi:NACHT domain.
MKRIGITFCILLLIIGFIFVGSLLLYPSWLQEKYWGETLFRSILLSGFPLFLGAIFSWFFSFFLLDKEFSERVLFVFGNKYNDISKRITEITFSEIDKEKRSRKYIANIFVETNEIKEKLRYFCEPYIFFIKIIERTKKEINDSYLIYILNQIHYPISKIKAPAFIYLFINQSKLRTNISLFRKYLDKNKYLLNLLVEKGAGLKPEYLESIPLEFSHIYDYVYPNLRYSSEYRQNIFETEEDLELLTNKSVIIKGLAGHGKTNLLCDFTENFLLRKKHVCIYLPAREFNNLVNEETIEQRIAQIIFADSSFQFADILRLIKFRKPNDFLYILIDGINEHKNYPLFSLALEQFIQRCNSTNIKVIITCRSEYFDNRFGNLLLVKNQSVIDLDAWKYVNHIPDVHQKTLISKYFEEFNIALQIDHINQNIIGIFNKDKLILRIFCEAYENEIPAEFLEDLFKLEIFNKYFEKKLEAVNGLEYCLQEIITWMINHNEFSNILISNFSKDTATIIEATTYENIVVRKDIISTPGIAFCKSEVMNFVYDEFRDFLIASKIIINWENNNQLAKIQINQFTKAGSVISEGLQKYLCLWGIKNNQHELIKFLSSYAWFDEVFIESVRNSPDQLHSDFIINILKMQFRTNINLSLHIIFFLFKRINNERFTKLNIDLLFNWITELDETEYQNIICDSLNLQKDYNISYITYLCQLFCNLFENKKIKPESAPKVIKFLCYLSGVNDINYPKYNRLGLGTYPAVIALYKIHNFYETKLIIEQITSTLNTFHLKLVQSNLKELVAKLGN